MHDSDQTDAAVPGKAFSDKYANEVLQQTL
jgi:hypothetical protein